MFGQWKYLQESRTEAFLRKPRPELGFIQDEKGKLLTEWDKKLGKEVPRYASYAHATNEDMNITSFSGGKFLVTETIPVFVQLARVAIEDYDRKVGVFLAVTHHKRMDKVRKLAFELDFVDAKENVTEDDIKAYHREVIRKALLQFLPKGNFQILISMRANKKKQKKGNVDGEDISVGVHTVIIDTEKPKESGVNGHDMEFILPHITRALHEYAPRTAENGQNPWDEVNDPGLIYNGLRFNFCLKCTICPSCDNDEKHPTTPRNACYTCRGMGVLYNMHDYRLKWVLNSDGTWDDAKLDYYTQRPVEEFLDTSLLLWGDVHRHPDLVVPEAGPCLISPENAPKLRKSAKRKLDPIERKKLTDKEYKGVSGNSKMTVLSTADPRIRIVESHLQAHPSTKYADMHVEVMWEYPGSQPGQVAYYRIQSDSKYCMNLGGLHGSSSDGSSGNRVYFILKLKKGTRGESVVYLQCCYSPDKQSTGIKCSDFNKLKSQPHAEYTVAIREDAKLLFPYTSDKPNANAKASFSLAAAINFGPASSSEKSGTNSSASTTPKKAPRIDLSKMSIVKKESVAEFNLEQKMAFNLDLPDKQAGPPKPSYKRSSSDLLWPAQQQAEKKRKLDAPGTPSSSSSTSSSWGSFWS